jgi:hypothetical protein
VGPAAWLVVLLLVAPAAAAETLEEVVAVVGSSPILASDVALADLVHLVERAPGEDAGAYRSRLLDARIRLELQFRWLEETGALYRLSPDVAASAAELEASIGPDSEPRLAELGLSANDLTELALRIAATRAQVEQRLRPRIKVSRAELDEAYQRLVDEELLPAGAEVPPLEAVAAQLERLLTERKLNSELELWLEQARERFAVRRYVP